MLVEGRIWVGACISWVFQGGLLLAGASCGRRLNVSQKKCRRALIIKNLLILRWLCGSLLNFKFLCVGVSQLGQAVATHALLRLSYWVYYKYWRISWDRLHQLQKPKITQIAIDTVNTNCLWGMPRLGSWLSTYWPTKLSNKWRCSQRTSAEQTSIFCVPITSLLSLWLKLKRSVKGGRPGALKPDKLDLSRKGNKFSDPGTQNLGALPTQWPS